MYGEIVVYTEKEISAMNLWHYLILLQKDKTT